MKSKTKFRKPKPIKIVDRPKYTKKETTCNLCGLSCLIGCDKSFIEPCGLIKASVSGGYESTPGNGHGTLDDMTSYTFSLCEFCLDWLFSQFKFSVKIFDYIDGEVLEEKFRPAEVRVEKDDWRKMKKEFFAEKKKRDKAREKAKENKLDVIWENDLKGVYK